MISYLHKYGYYYGFFILGIVLFFPFLGNFHLFDWDEINFAESSREMLLSGNFMHVQIDFEPFQEKPPLFFWIQSFSMKVFGVNEFAARFPNALIGIISMLVLFNIGKKIRDNRFGLIWVLVYIGSFLPFLYFRSGIIDPLFNLFIFLGVFKLLTLTGTLEKKQRYKYALFAGLFIGMAIITKGPVGFLLLFLTFIVYWALERFRKIISFKEILIFCFSAFLITCLWFGYETFKNGPWFLLEFINYQIELFSQPVAGHEQPFYYHFIIILIGCFPMSIIALPRFFKTNIEEQFSIERWMKILFWVVLILFTIVSTKIVHYSSMCYLPLSFLAALELYDWKNIEYIKKWILGVLVGIGSVFSFCLVAVPLIAINKEGWLIPIVEDPFALASLDLNVGWKGYEYLIGFLYAIALFFFIGCLYKRKIEFALIVLVIGLGSSMILFSKYVVPKIEMYSQGPAIEFYESIQDENKYVITVGFKSYAHYFYARTNQLDPSDSLFHVKERKLNELLGDNTANRLNSKQKKHFDSDVLEWLKNGDIDKTVYFVSRIDREHQLEDHQNIDKLYNKGGFVFYKRAPKKE